MVMAMMTKMRFVSQKCRDPGDSFVYASALVLNSSALHLIVRQGKFPRQASARVAGTSPYWRLLGGAALCQCDQSPPNAHVVAGGNRVRAGNWSPSRVLV